MTSTGKMIVTLFVLIIIAVIIYFVARPGDMVAPTDTVGEGIPTEIPTEGEKMTFTEFVRQGGTYECSVDISVNETLAKGVVLLDGMKVRGDYSVNIEEATIDATFISDGEYAYTWSSAAPTQGIKIKVNPDAPVGSPEALDFSQIKDYDCKAWVADATKFVPPTHVTFTALN